MNVGNYIEEDARTDWDGCWFWGIPQNRDRGRSALAFEQTPLSPSREAVALAMATEPFSLLALDQDRSLWLVGQTTLRGGWIEFGRRLGVLQDDPNEHAKAIGEALKALTFLGMVASEEMDRLENQARN